MPDLYWKSTGLNFWITDLLLTNTASKPRAGFKGKAHGYEIPFFSLT